jgi:hypothetical protein
VAATDLAGDRLCLWASFGGDVAGMDKTARSLLYAIGHVPNGFADAAAFGRVIKKLDVVDIHGETMVHHHRFYQCLHPFFRLTPRPGAGVFFEYDSYIP